MAELGAALEKSISVNTDVTQAYFAILHAPHPDTGEEHVFLMKGKSGNKLRIFGGEADEGESPKEAILRETAEETGFIHQESGEITNSDLYEELSSTLKQAFEGTQISPIYSREHELTEIEIAKGWHPSQNHVFEIECDYSLLERLHDASAMAQTPEGQGTCFLPASDILQMTAGAFRHPYESIAIGIHMLGEEMPDCLPEL